VLNLGPRILRRASIYTAGIRHVVTDVKLSTRARQSRQREDHAAVGPFGQGLRTIWLADPRRPNYFAQILRITGR
jgi:hypothetical protein